MVRPEQLRNSGLIKLATVFAISIFVSGCTSTSYDGVSASSSHKSGLEQSRSAQLPVIDTGTSNSVNNVGVIAASDRDGQQMAALDNNPTQTPPPGHNNPAPIQNQATNDASRSGVVNQQNSNPVNTDIQTASLNSAEPITQTGPDAMAYADPQSPESLAQQRIDRIYPTMDHGVCKGGWATPPDKLDAKRVTLGHPYYMEIRLRNTPLFPVGHTYIAYGRMAPDGTLLEERMVMLSPVGGYGGAAVAAALPMPGILKPLKDDCKIKPHAAYRVSLTAVQFEKMLLRIQVAKKKVPAYALFAYNCNHFVSDIAAVVGILPPKNIYLPAVKYLYALIEANEGFNPLKPKRG